MFVRIARVTRCDGVCVCTINKTVVLDCYDFNTCIIQHLGMVNIIFSTCIVFKRVYI